MPGKYKPKQKTEYRPNPGAMYVHKSEKGNMYNLVLNVEELPEADEKGVIRLVGFKNDYKEKDNQPDVRFFIPKPRAEGASRPPRQKDSASQDSDAGGDDWF